METPPEHHKKSFKKQIMSCVISAMLFLLVPSGGVLIYNELGQVKLNQAMKEAEALGGLVSLEQLMAARKTYPDDKNGANVILGIKDRLQAICNEDKLDNMPACDAQGKPCAPGRRWSAAEDQRIRVYLDKTQEALAAIDTLKQYEGGRFPMAYDLDYSDAFPDYLHALDANRKLLRTAIHLKRLQVLDRALHGDASHLVDDATVMLRIGNLLADEPSISPTLFHGACNALTVQTVEYVCALTPVQPTQLLELQNILGRLDEGDRRIAWAIRGERAFLNNMVDSALSTNVGHGLLSRFNSKMNFMRGYMKRDEAKGVRLYNRLLAATEASRGLEESRTLVKNMPSIEADTLFAGFWFSPSTNAFIQNTRLIAWIRCAQVAMATERYRIETGSFPAQLDQLVSKYIEKIPADPFKPDQPLKYTVKADRVVIYSISDDGTDNGGDVNHAYRSTTKETDCGFILLFPAARNQPPLPTTTTSAPAK